MITVRNPETIYQARGQIKNGTFHGRWHFSFDQYYDPEYTHFGTLRVFNDDTLSPGAVWPLHPHRDNEVVTYCAGGEFRHEDEHGKGGIPGWAGYSIPLWGGVCGTQRSITNLTNQCALFRCGFSRQHTAWSPR